MYIKGKNQDILSRVYWLAWDGQNPYQIEAAIPHHYLSLIQILLRDKFGKKLSLSKIRYMLLQEGLLPWPSYGVPDWYTEKWFPPKTQVKENEQDLQEA